MTEWKCHHNCTETTFVCFGLIHQTNKVIRPLSKDSQHIRTVASR